MNITLEVMNFIILLHGCRYDIKRNRNDINYYDYEHDYEHDYDYDNEHDYDIMTMNYYEHDVELILT